MRSRRVRVLRRRIWPKDDLELLLRAAFLPDDAALQSWREWKRRRNLEDVGWEEHKLLARIAGKLTRLDPDCSYRPRLEGLAKAHWTQSQLMLRASAAALDVLIGAGIPVMLLKGGALQAAGLNSGPRITGDLDVLVRRTDYPRAVKLLYDDGWSSKNSAEFASLSWRFRHGINVRQPPHGDIDVHHQPVHGARVGETVLDAMWARARQASFHGRPVRVPSVPDMLVFAAEHAVHACASKEPSAAWVFDIARLVAQAPEAGQVVACAREFDALPAMGAVLAYCEELLPGHGAKHFLQILEAEPQTVSQWLRFVLNSTPPPMGRLLRSLMRRLSPVVGFESERAIVPRIHPDRIPRRTRHELNTGDAGCVERVRQGILLPAPGISPRKMQIEILFRPASAHRYLFDVVADGSPLARLSARVSGDNPSDGRRLLATVPCAGRALQHISVEALAKYSLPLNASAQDEALARPLPFCIKRIGWD